MNTINEDIERTRKVSDRYHICGQGESWPDTMHRLAAEVERLREELSNMKRFRDEVAEAANSHADDAQNRQVEVERLRATLELIACGPRPDGTYNRCREACETLAKEALK